VANVRWEDERYIRVFTRDTPAWDALGWEAQALLVQVFRKMDRTGLLALGGSGRRGLAANARMPLDVVERALAVLLEDGVLSMLGPDIFCKNFMAAQECAKSDALRSKEKRERAHLRMTQEVSGEPQEVAQAPRSDTNAPRSDTPSVPSDPSVPSVLKKRSRASLAETSLAFAQFWAAYPKKTGKGQAMKAWPGDELLPAILAALAWQAPTWDPNYTKNPATWLNARCWEDEKPQPSLFQKPRDPSVGHYPASSEHPAKTGRMQMP
jgi:hypothetical protein